MIRKLTDTARYTYRMLTIRADTEPRLRDLRDPVIAGVFIASLLTFCSAVLFALSGALVFAVAGAILGFVYLGFTDSMLRFIALEDGEPNPYTDGLVLGEVAA
ncbi:hypothetical protein [Halobaculum sp. P14]|uniref:hypothetical protein n=1 Tax=Halobaculum sp. P14 TaxID=3421638 RepID=UPI003EB778FD